MPRSELKVLYTLLDRHHFVVVPVAAWALGRAGDRVALRPLEDRYRKLMCRPNFERGVGADEGMIRVAKLRLRKMNKQEARRTWANLLRSDPNHLVRAEAAQEVVRVGHPQALELLRRAIADAKSSKSPRDEILAQAATALGLLGKREAIGDLKALLGTYSELYHVAYRPVLELELCHTFMDNRCPRLPSVDGYARRALEKITGEPWPDRRPGQKPPPVRCGGERPVL